MNISKKIKELFNSSSASAAKTSSRHFGHDIELQAESFLARQGLKPVCRNYTLRSGEIDLIMRDGDVLVFIEVRYRKDISHGSGAESITPAKQQKLIRTAEHYLQQEYGSRVPDCRFDVISASGEPVMFDWLKNVFG
ncbi:MAG: YraN family protein [Oleibacter sp.]|nr:YraN family protein [Thalassolituus sp.]|tara:strand:+ start:124 stop:534 length:411 start_codon:yes stop_codon:yes gene_type:complete